MRSWLTPSVIMGFTQMVICEKKYAGIYKIKSHYIEKRIRQKKAWAVSAQTIADLKYIQRVNLIVDVEHNWQLSLWLPDTFRACWEFWELKIGRQRISKWRNYQNMQPQFQRFTDDQWEVIKQFLNWQRKRKVSLRDVFDAILFITRSGIQLRNLCQTSFPHWQAVYYYFDKWKKNGTLDKINLSLNQIERLQKDNARQPSLGLVDSQSVKLAPTIFEHRGTDGNKKVNGRKRHILVDVLGRVYDCHVHAANLHDSPQGEYLLKNSAEFGSRLEKIMADKSYRETFAEAVSLAGLIFEVPPRDDNQKGFVIEAKRWVEERTFAWMNFFRRIVIDYEHTPQSARSFVLMANISMCLWRIDFSGLWNFPTRSYFDVVHLF